MDTKITKTLITPKRVRHLDVRPRDVQHEKILTFSSLLSRAEKKTRHQQNLEQNPAKRRASERINTKQTESTPSKPSSTFVQDRSAHSSNPSIASRIKRISIMVSGKSFKEEHPLGEFVLVAPSTECDLCICCDCRLYISSEF